MWDIIGRVTAIVLSLAALLFVVGLFEVVVGSNRALSIYRLALLLIASYILTRIILRGV